MSADESRHEAALAAEDQRKREVRSAQVRLLYENSATGIAVTIIAALLLAYFQWPVVPHPIVVGWSLYMLIVTVARFILARRYWRWRSSSSSTQIDRWSAAFVIGAGMSAAGWGGAGILLYPGAQPMNQVFLVFILGGMMLGGASLLASRFEAFLAFLLPTGLLPAIRLLSEGDDEHVAMGFLAIIFTAATLTTTWRFYRTIEASLTLRFENQHLLKDLKIAKDHSEALNDQLERRVEERTAELHESTEHLRAEIKQREQMEEELLRARKMESLGVLAGGIAHDFNNFLAIVQGSIEAVMMQLNPGPPVREILEQTARACQRAVFLSSQLLTFAKGGDPIRRVVSVAKLVSDAVSLARAGDGVSVDVDIVEDLWPAEVDVGQIGQVFHNILLNAKEAMPPGGTIEVRADNVGLRGDKQPGSGSHVRISIRDYGCGIRGDVLPLIFDPYFTTKPSGSGLGLATAYAIVAKHNGRLSVKSTYGVGTVITVELPASPSSPEPESPAGTHLQRGTGRLLVMDDEETLRTLLAHVLTTLGYEVLSARDGAEAIDLYEAAQASGRRFDAVLLDLTVRAGMGGVETAKRLKELDPSVKLIASSGYSDASVMTNFRDYGFDDVLAKPWAIVQLSQVFRRVLVPDSRRLT